LWWSSSSVCDGEHFVLKIHKLLLLFDLAFKKYPSLTPFRFILVGLMNMIMVCSLATKFFDRHNAVLVSPWWCSIDKWHAERL
jgi:hypothetical protein